MLLPTNLCKNCNTGYEAFFHLNLNGSLNLYTYRPTYSKNPQFEQEHVYSCLVSPKAKRYVISYNNRTLKNVWKVLRPSN